MKLPHIVLFNPDEWRGDVLGHVGNPAAVTPVLDELVATEAVSFSRAFCQNPVCTPSRCSFMTGWYPHVRGHRTMYHMLRADEPMLLRTLKEHGYYVFWAGKNDVVPAQHGFEAYCHVRLPPPRILAGAGVHQPEAWRGRPGGDNFYSFYRGRLDVPPGVPHPPDGDWALIEGVLNFLRDPPRDRPICLYVALGFPHPPYQVEEPWYSRIDRRALPPRAPTPPGWNNKPRMLRGIYERQGLSGWSEERWQELRATYYGMCARVDEQFGLVIAALREAGLYDDAAIFFFSDHGDFAGDYGLVEKNQNTFEDCLTRVPLVVKPPRGTPVAPGVRDQLVELIDVPATVEDLTGIQPRHTHFGRSLLPLLADPRAPGRDAVFSEGGRRHGEVECMELESTGAQDPASLYWPRVALQHCEGPHHTKAVMCRTSRYKYVYVRRLYEPDELYDLQTDPMELNNRIDDPRLSHVLAELKDRMLTFLLETADVVPHDTDVREVGP